MARRRACSAACDRPLTSPEKGAALGAAAGTGIGLVTGGSFGTVVGAGLIGGAVGYLGGTAVDSSRRESRHEDKLLLPPLRCLSLRLRPRRRLPPLNFEQAAYITCREAQAMNVEARKSLAIYLAEHSARYRGVAIPDDERGGSSPCWCAAAARWRPTPTCSR